MSGWGAIYSNTTYALGLYGNALAKLQEQASSGARIIRPSDDPTDANRIMYLRAQTTAGESYKRNLDDVLRNLQNGSGIMQEMSSNLARVRQLVTQAGGASYTASNRVPMANEIDAILEQMVALGNTQSLGRYIFSGATSNVPPFAVTRNDAGKITAVTYQGSDKDLPVPVAPGIEYSGLFVGGDVFQQNNRQDPQFLGRTGLTLGSGSASVQGDVWITVEHAATTLNDGGAGTNIAVGSGSAGGDTILGDHTITLDADAQTIRLDDGTALSYADASLDLSNLKLTNGAGDEMYVDLSSLSASGVVTIDVHADGTMSLDGGETTVPIDFSTNQAITDPANGRVLYVNSSSVRRTGPEPVNVPGTYDIFNSLITARDVLLNKHQMPTNQQIDLLDSVSETIKIATERLSQSMTTAGGKIQAMETLRTTQENIMAEADEQADLLEDADIAIVASQLARTQALYQMTLTVSGKLLSLNLMDFLS